MPYLLFFIALFAITPARAGVSLLPPVTVTASAAGNSAQIVEQVNHYYNSRFIYQSELNDRWLARDEFVRAGGGDCEDFALSKYQTLLEAGLTADQFRFVYALHTKTDDYHIALLHTPTAKLLDSLTSDTRPLAQREDLIEQFQFTARNFFPAGISRLSRAQLRTLQSWQRQLHAVEQGIQP